MPTKKNKDKVTVDNDSEFYKNSSFILKTMTDLAVAAHETHSKDNSLELLKSIINDYEHILHTKINHPPYDEIIALKKQAEIILKRKRKIFLEKSPMHYDHYLPPNLITITGSEYFNQILAIRDANYDINQIWLAHMNNSVVVGFLEKHFKNYIPIAASLFLIDRLKSSGNFNNFLSIFLCLIALLKIDHFKTYSFFRSEDYEKYISHKKGKKDSDTFWGARNDLENKAVVMAEELWNSGDTKWHSQMAVHIAQILNEPILKKIHFSLNKKFPKHKIDPIVHQNYEKEFKKRIRGETICISRLKTLLLPISEKFNRNRVPNRQGKKLLKLNYLMDMYDNIFD